MIFQAATGAFAALFAAMAILQLLDGGGGRLVAFQASAAALSMLPLFGTALPTLYLGLSILGFSWALSLLPQLASAGVVTQADGRVLASLVLGGAWMLVLYVRANQERRALLLAKRAELHARDAATHEAGEGRAQ